MLDRNLVRDVIEGIYESKRSRGRNDESVLDDLKARESYYDMKRKTEDGQVWRELGL